MRNLVEVSDEIKAVAQSCTGTPTAKLIALLNAAGITKATEIAAILGISDRAVRKAKAELQDRNHSSGGTTVPELQDRAEPQFRNYSSENGTAVPKSALARVEEKLLPPKQEDTGLVKNPLYPPNVIAVTSWNTAFAPLEERCRLVNGMIVLNAAMRAEWLERFAGDDVGLDLALTQAAAYVQTNASTPLEARVGSQLARIVSERRDKDRRYAAAASQRAASAQTQTAKPSRILEAIARRSAAGEALQ